MAVNKKYDVFISYRRENKPEIARIVKLLLQRVKIECFLDVDSLEGGYFDIAIFDKIRECRVFVLVLAKSDFELCKSPNDWVRQEILFAIRQKIKIFPVLVGDFQFPDMREFPDEFNILPKIPAVHYSSDNQNLITNNILNILKGINSSKRKNIKFSIQKPSNFFKNTIKFLIKLYSISSNTLKGILFVVAVISAYSTFVFVKEKNDTFIAIMSAAGILLFVSLIGYIVVFPFRIIIKIILALLSEKTIHRIKDVINEYEWENQDIKKEILDLIPRK